MTVQSPVSPAANCAAGDAVSRSAAAAQAPDLLDADAIARLRELDPGGANQLMERIVAAYMKSLDRLLPELAAARLGDLNLAVVRHVSHTLKSSSASLGALSLAKRCGEIEALVRHGPPDAHAGRLEFDTLLDGMLAEIAEVRVALLALQNPGT